MAANLDLNEHIEFKNRELKNLRFLCKATLHQKSMLDNFLMESIECAKNGGDDFDQSEDLKSRTNKFSTTDKFKAKKVGTPGANQSEHESERLGDTNRLQIGKTELKDLSWEDREKILRVIFAKITLGVSPSYWKRIEAEFERKKRREEGQYLPGIRQNGLH